MARNPLVGKRIKSAVDHQLPAKGLRLDPSDPDLKLAYHTGVEDRVNVTDRGYRYGHRYHRHGGRDITVTHYQEGTLILDFVDSGTNELVLRVSARALLQENLTPEQIEKNIQGAVAKMLERYPPKPR
jgi:hypothetical protein